MKSYEADIEEVVTRADEAMDWSKKMVEKGYELQLQNIAIMERIRRSG